VRVLGLDIGEKRVGVALSDSSGRVATPLTVIDSKAAQKNGAELVRIVADYEIDHIVVGLPLTMEGEQGPQARRVLSLSRRITERLGLPVVYVDERLSSAEAVRRMRDSGETEREMRGSVDMVAAALFLQTHLDERRGTDPH